MTASTEPVALDRGPQGPRYDIDRFSDVSSEHWAIAERRFRRIRPILLLDERSRARRTEIRRASFDLQVNEATIYRWLARSPREALDLVPRAPGVPRGRSKLRAPVRALIDDGLRKHFLTKQKPKLAKVVETIGEECRAAGFDAPSRKSIQARLDLLDKLEVAKARGEHQRAERLAFRPGQYDVERPMEVWQVDSTRVDLMVVSAVDGTVIGRPWLTIAMDVSSRMVAGFYLTFRAPSSLSVAMTLMNAISPKGEYLRSLGFEGHWPICGLPRALHTDNGTEFAHAEAYRRGCGNYDIDIILRPPGTPRFGGHIERLIGTMMGRVHFLPGTTFSNPARRERYDSAAEATKTIGEVEGWFVEEILAYHNRRHGTLGCTPLQAWEMQTREGAIQPSLPDDLEAFRRDFLPIKYAKIQRHALEFNTLEYASDVLGELKRFGQDRIPFRYDPRDLSRIYVMDRRGDYVAVPNKHPDCPAISLWEVAAEKKRRQLSGAGAATGSLMITGILRQREALRAKAGLTRRELKDREHDHQTEKPPTPSLAVWRDVFSGGGVR